MERSNNSAPPSQLSWKTRMFLSFFSHVTSFTRRSDGTVNRRLLDFLDFQIPPNPNTNSTGVSSSDVTVDPSRNLWFRIFTSTTNINSPSLPVVIYFHGGGFTYFSASSKNYDAICRRFVLELPVVMVSVNYRLSPEHRFPCQHDDGIDVLKYLNQNPNLLPPNADLAKTFLAGDSAGANLAHHVAVRACQLEPKLEKPKVIGLLSLQPFFGGEERTESEIRLKATPMLSVEETDWLWRLFLPEGESRDHWAVNVSGPNGVDISKFEDFPAVMVVVGGLDPLRDRQVSYYKWLERSGKEAVLVDYPNMIHCFFIFPELSESGRMIMDVKNFISKQAQD